MGVETGNHLTLHQALRSKDESILLNAEYLSNVRGVRDLVEMRKEGERRSREKRGLEVAMLLSLSALWVATREIQGKRVSRNRIADCSIDAYQRQTCTSSCQEFA